MLLKLAAIGSIGIIAYKIYDSAKLTRQRNLQTAVAGGPLSDEAVVVPAGSSAEVWPTVQPK